MDEIGSAGARMIRIMLISVLCYIGAGSWPVPAQVATTPKGDFAAPPGGQSQGAWRHDCDETGGFAQTSCRMMQTVIIKETGAPLLTAMIEKRQGDRALSLLLKVPHGVLLTPGMRLQFHGIDPVVLKYRLSDQTGIFATTVLSDRMLEALKNGDVLKVTVVTATRQSVGIPLALDGFAAAFEEFSAPR